MERSWDCTWVTLDEGVDMDASPSAPSIKHHCVEDSTVVCWAAEAGKKAADAVGQVQDGGPDLGSAHSCEDEQQQQKKRPGGLHGHSGDESSVTIIWFSSLTAQTASSFRSQTSLQRKKQSCHLQVIWPHPVKCPDHRDTSLLSQLFKLLGLNPLNFILDQYTATQHVYNSYLMRGIMMRSKPQASR